MSTHIQHLRIITPHHSHSELSQEKLQNRLEWLMRAAEISSRSISDLKLKQPNTKGSHLADTSGKFQTSEILYGSGGAILDSQYGAVEAGYEGSQFDMHRILALDHKSTQTIPLSKMISWYGEAEGGGTCWEDFGNTLINKWRGAKESYCGAGNSTLHRESSIDCFLLRQTRHHGDGDNLCVMKNVAVNMGAYILMPQFHCCCSNIFRFLSQFFYLMRALPCCISRTVWRRFLDQVCGPGIRQH